MKKSSLRRSAAVIASFAALSLPTWAQAQVVDTPQNFSLPANIVIPDQFFFGMPLTLDIGDIDDSIVSQTGGETLNDVAIMSVINQIAAGEEGIGRIYTITHSSGSDTQSLELLDPVDVPISISDPNKCYTFPSSVHIMDLNGDDTNDLAFMSTNCASGSGPGVTRGAIFGIQGSASEPFQVASSLTQLGSQNDGIFIPPFIFSSIGGQLTLATGDFDGDGLEDLAFYDGDETVPTNQIHTLLNDGTLGLLPSQLSNVLGPVNPPTEAAGVLVNSGDFNGDGTIDLAIAYFVDGGQNTLQVYSGNGDATFASQPIAEVSVSDIDVAPNGLASGNFDNNDFSDFALGFIDDDEASFIAIIQCSPGTPANCNNSLIPIGTGETGLTGNLTTADFNNDGLDDLASVHFAINESETTALSMVDLRLNNGNGFDIEPDQQVGLNTQSANVSFINQVVAKDIDACGGPDLAYTGLIGSIDINTEPEPVLDVAKLAQSITAGSPTNVSFEASVAFNSNEAPIANAGEPTAVTGGVQVGGTTSNPTCSDPTDDAMEISWVVTSGDATISDSSAANPIISNSIQDTVLEVTCTDACGLSDTDTVTVPATGFIQGSCTSITGVASVPFNLTWLMIPAALGFMATVRRKKS